jgi:hypothetical protein
LPLQFLLTLLEFVFALAEPEPAGAQVGFELTGPGIDRGFTAIDLAQALAKVAGELRDLELKLLAARLDCFACYRSKERWRRLIGDFQERLAKRLLLFCGSRYLGGNILSERVRRIDSRLPLCLGWRARSRFCVDYAHRSVPAVVRYNRYNRQSFPHLSSAGAPSEFTPFAGCWFRHASWGGCQWPQRLQCRR